MALATLKANHGPILQARSASTRLAFVAGLWRLDNDPLAKLPASAVGWIFWPLLLVHRPLRFPPGLLMPLSSSNRLALHSSGWLDYYDHAFDPKGPDTPVWRRTDRPFPLRREGFWSMAQVGFSCVPNGLVSALASSYPEGVEFVVYTDEREHQGEGKEKLPVADALARHPTAWASLYVPPAARIAESLRLLRVGSLGFALRYQSASDWRSNVSTDRLEVISTRLLDDKSEALDHLMKRYRTPLLAVDLVPSQRGWLATDLNLAPGLRGTGIEDRLPPRVAYNKIKQAFVTFCSESL